MAKVNPLAKRMYKDYGITLSEAKQIAKLVGKANKAQLKAGKEISPDFSVGAERKAMGRAVLRELPVAKTASSQKSERTRTLGRANKKRK